MSNRLTMTQFESLPNELIYLIFKYLNANEIFHALLNLNWRLTALVSDYADYKVDFRSVSKSNYDSICGQMNPTQVQTLHLSNKRYTCGQIEDFFKRFSLNSFSSRLRSLSLKSCHEKEYKQIIDQLPLLTNLTVFSLVANADANISYESRHQLVQVVAQLPSLRRCTMKIYNDELVFDLFGLVFPALTYLCLGISSLDQMVHLCRRAPHLRHLIIDAVIADALSVDDCSSLRNLTHLSLRADAGMQEFERLLLPARSLVSLSLVCSNFECRDGNRWQQILSKINLSNFNFLFLTDAMQATESLIDPFYDKFWLERGWYVRYEQQKVNDRIELYTIPYSGLAFLLNLADTCTTVMNKSIDATEIFQSTHELVYVGCQTEISNNNDYFFPHIETLVLENDTLPPSTLVSFQHVKELRSQSMLTHHMLEGVSMPALTRLILHVVPATWTVPCLNGRIQCLKLRTGTSLTDQEVEAMCAPTSFAVNCKHVSLTIESRQSVRLLLRQLTCLESADFLFSSPTILDNLFITENWIREETYLTDFLLTIDTTDGRLGLWIGRANQS